MKKLLIASVIIVICITGCTKKEPTPQVPEYIEELKLLGYQEETIEKLKEKLSEAELEKITEFDYIEVILEIVNDSEFKRENLEKYLKYYEAGMNGKAIVYIVNNDIKYTYNEKLLSIMNHPYFIASNLDRYMSYESDQVDEIIQSVNTNIDREFYTEIKKTDTEKGILLITNKYYQLEKDYHYGELVTMSTRYSNKSGQKLNKEAYEEFKKLVEAGEKEGVHIRNLSAYRSYNTQNSLYNNYLKENGKEWADKWSARPGHSEHQTGLALDVAVKGNGSFNKFEDTKEFEWIKENAHEFGFIMRYPKDKTNITGYGYEPWHYRYVGVDVAKYIYENDITYEEYYAYFVEQNNQQVKEEIANQ